MNVCICERGQGPMLSEHDDDVEMKYVEVKVGLICTNGTKNFFEDLHMMIQSWMEDKHYVGFKFNNYYVDVQIMDTPLILFHGGINMSLFK